MQDSTVASTEGQRRYSRVAVLLHWTIALLIVANYLIGTTFWGVAPPASKPWMPLHMSLGMTVLALSAVRLVWRLTHRPPPFPASMGLWEKRAAAAAHWAFYAFILVLPLTGWLSISAHQHPKSVINLLWITHWPLAPIQGIEPNLLQQIHDWTWHTHEWLADWGFPLLLILHLGGVLKHQFLDRESVLPRMSLAPFAHSARPESGERVGGSDLTTGQGRREEVVRGNPGQPIGDEA